MPEFETIEFNSSVIERAGYDADSQTLRVNIKGDARNPARVYDYFGVPVAVWHGFCVADSAGSYYTSQIKGKFNSIRVS